MLEAGNVIQSFGYFLPDLTRSIRMAIFNFASVPGALVIAFLGDRFAATTVIVISSLSSAVGVFIFWGLSTQIALLMIFTIIYGFFAGSFSSTWPSITQQLMREEEGVDTGLILRLLLDGRGIGNVISGPISVTLLVSSWRTSGNFGYGTEYGPAILFTDVTALLGGLGWIWKTWKQIAV
jgi:MFS family permease